MFYVFARCSDMSTDIVKNCVGNKHCILITDVVYDRSSNLPYSENKCKYIGTYRPGLMN